MAHVHVVLAALAATGCAKAPKDSPPGARRELEAPGPAAVDRRVAGTIAGHRFTIAIDGGRVTRSDAEAWSWALGAGEVSIQEVGAADADTHFLVERSPRTIVRAGDQGPSVLTEVVLVAGGRVFRCTHEEPVEDPDAPAGRAAVERGVAACASLRVEP